jgi:hypothetical protein
MSLTETRACAAGEHDRHDEPLSQRARANAVLAGRRPALLPCIVRLDIWYGAHRRAGTLPAEFTGLDLPAIHRRLNLGRLRQAPIYTYRLRNVECTVSRNGEVLARDFEPLLRFPAPWNAVSRDHYGETLFELSTPVGRGRMRYVYNEAMAEGCLAPYLIEHFVKERADYRTAEYIVEHAEVLQCYEAYAADDALVGDDGFVTAIVDRTPFQRLLLDFAGEQATFYALHDEPALVEHFLAVLAGQAEQMLQLAARSPAAVVELADNLDGFMTNPRLFRRFVMPYYQQAAEHLHACGKQLASHVDGDLASLAALLPDSGLDIAEAFTPAPMTRCTFPHAFRLWQKKPLIWGGIPSIILEATTDEAEFEAFLTQLDETVGPAGRIILGIGDQATGLTLIQRLRRLAGRFGGSGSQGGAGRVNHEDDENV